MKKIDLRQAITILAILGVSVGIMPLAYKLFHADFMAEKIMLTRESSFRELPRSELPIARWSRATQAFPSLRTVYERNKGSYDPEFEEWFDENILNELPSE